MFLYVLIRVTCVKIAVVKTLMIVFRKRLPRLSFKDRNISDTNKWTICYLYTA